MWMTILGTYSYTPRAAPELQVQLGSSTAAGNRNYTRENLHCKNGKRAALTVLAGFLPCRRLQTASRRPEEEVTTRGGAAAAPRCSITAKRVPFYWAPVEHRRLTCHELRALATRSTWSTEGTSGSEVHAY